MTVAGRRLIHDDEGLNSGVWPVSADHLVTPVDEFFIRSHAPTPEIDPRTWRLEVEGLVDRPRSFSLEDLAAYPRHEVTATLVCAGLRRDEYLALGPVAGELPWGPEPISTGRWTGVRLREVLQAVGVSPGATHVEFIGLDRVERQGRQFGFGGSVELAKALAPEVLLATELNGAPLPPAHGFPVRVVVPGWIGARSVKWLGRIVLRDAPSDNYFQSRAYRVQRETNPADPRDVSAGIAMSAAPLNAVVLEPTRDQVVPAGRVRVRGWAMGSGGRPVTRVEVSGDGGHSWSAAGLTAGDVPWTWSLWEAELSLPPGPQSVMVRATDSSGESQPETVGETWNVKGYGNNAWHRVPVQVVSGGHEGP
jgi:sulfite oxidase